MPSHSVLASTFRLNGSSRNLAYCVSPIRVIDVSVYRLMKNSSISGATKNSRKNAPSGQASFSS